MEHSTNFSEPHTLDQVGTRCVKICLTRKLVLFCCCGFCRIWRRNGCRRRGRCRRTTRWCRGHLCGLFGVFFWFFGTFLWATLLVNYEFGTSVKIIHECNDRRTFKNVGVISGILWTEMDGEIVTSLELLDIDRESVVFSYRRLPGCRFYLCASRCHVSECR